MRYGTNIKVLSVFAALFLAAPVFAVLESTPEIRTELNFGTVTPHTGMAASVTLSTNGAISFTNAGGLGGQTVGKIYVQKSALTSPQETITMSGATVTFGSCAIQITNHSFDPNNFALPTGATNNNKTVSWGATLNIPAGCESGVYNGRVAITADNTYSFGLYDRTHDLPFSVTIKKPITITNVSDLNFGAMASPASGGNVTVDQNGARAPAGVQLLGGTVSAGRFAVEGEPNNSVSLTMPSSADLTHQGGLETLRISGFVPATGTTFNLGAAGLYTLDIGATLTIPPGAKEGAYRGSYTITVNY